MGEFRRDERRDGSTATPLPDWSAGFQPAGKSRSARRDRRPHCRSA